MSLAKLQRRFQSLGLYDGKITRDANKALREAIQKYHESGLEDEEVNRLLASSVSQRRQ